MSKSSLLIGLLISTVSTTASAQRDAHAAPHPAPASHPAPAPHPAYHGNGGHIPPAPIARKPVSKPEVQTFPGGKIDSRPHVAGNHWYGHDVQTDVRFKLPHPYPHGRFVHVGPTFQYRVVRYDLNAHNFWFPGGMGFNIPAWDWPYAEAWCWSCTDDFVVYDDPDHPGWYLIYNTETGTYVHAQYLGT